MKFSISIPMLILLIFILAINLAGFLFIGIDKKRSLTNSERFKEVDFFIWAIFFGSLGVLSGMLFFRHKTQKLKFIFGISILLLQQVALGYFLFLQN